MAENPRHPLHRKLEFIKPYLNNLPDNWKNAFNNTEHAFTQIDGVCCVKYGIIEVAILGGNFSKQATEIPDSDFMDFKCNGPSCESFIRIWGQNRILCYAFETTEFKCTVQLMQKHDHCSIANQQGKILKYLDMLRRDDLFSFLNTHTGFLLHQELDDGLLNPSICVYDHELGLNYDENNPKNNTRHMNLVQCKGCRAKIYVRYRAVSIANLASQYTENSDKLSKHSFKYRPNDVIDALNIPCRKPIHFHGQNVMLNGLNSIIPALSYILLNLDWVNEDEYKIVSKMQQQQLQNEFTANILSFNQYDDDTTSTDIESENGNTTAAQGKF